MKIIIAPPKPSWSSDFQRLKANILPLLPPGAYVHHIGSTSVLGLAAKDIVDIQVTVPKLGLVDIDRIVADGYRKGGHTSDHCPAGMNVTPIELEKLLFIAEGPPRAHIHIREKGRFNQHFPLVCRDYLRVHPVSTRAYEQIKQRLAGFFPDNQAAYYDIKDPVFDLIFDAALEWAQRTGWREPAPD